MKMKQKMWIPIAGRALIATSPQRNANTEPTDSGARYLVLDAHGRGSGRILRIWWRERKLLLEVLLKLLLLLLGMDVVQQELLIADLVEVG